MGLEDRHGQDIATAFPSLNKLSLECIEGLSEQFVFNLFKAPRSEIRKIDHQDCYIIEWARDRGVGVTIKEVS